MRNSHAHGVPLIADPAIPPTWIPFPAELFVVAFLTDIVFWQTGDPLWTTMSSWLLLAGLVLATAALALEWVRQRGVQRLRCSRRARVHMLGDGLAFALSVVNFVFHVRDGYSAVVPAGPLLSGAVVFILLSAGWVGCGLTGHLLAILDAGAEAGKES